MQMIRREGDAIWDPLTTYRRKEDFWQGFLVLSGMAVHLTSHAKK